KGAYWPTLSMEAVYMRTEENPAHPLFIEESLHVGFRLNFLIFDGGLRRAEIRQTKARQRQAELLREDLRKSINIEVESIYLDLMTQKGILEFLENQVIFAKDNFDLISRKYEFGLATGIDVMDASALLVTSKRQLSEAAYNYELSLVRLKRATGTLLESVEGR
ncbi:TolC family protein, partial [Thermodesulfovibrionales bacterium]|nr:TolC family protein [Thermodesulfovibrionales bacterium]